MNLIETSCLKSEKSKLVCTSSKEFIIFTDLHYISKKANVGNDLQNILKNSGDLKQIKYMYDMTDCLIDEIIEYNPNGGVIICGDLTYDGEKISHEELRLKLQRLLDKGIKVYIVPGNHDINNHNACQYKSSQKNPIDFVTQDEFRDIYKDFGFENSVSKDKYSLSYIAEISDNLWFLMVDSNFYQCNDCKNPVAITGKIHESTYQWIEENLKVARQKNVKVIAVSHHSLVDHSDLLNKGYTLEENQKIIELYTKYNVLLNLSGHLHVQHIKPGISKNIKGKKIYDISTSSLVVYRNQYGILSYTENKDLYYRTKRLNVSEWARKKKCKDENLLNFDEYSYNYSCQQTYNKIHSELVKSNLSEDDSKQMSFTLSELNPAFFSGTVVEIHERVENSENYKMWSEVSDIFYHKYIESIMKEKKYDHNTLRLSLREDDGSVGQIIWK